MIGLIFSGQGAQYPGMGQSLCERYPEAKKHYERASAVLGYDPVKLDEKELAQTLYAQPAIVTFSLALWAILQKKAMKKGLENVFFRKNTVRLAGFSLGEYTALGAAGILDIDDLLNLVVVRSCLMNQAGQHNPGTMAAVLGLSDDEVLAILSQEPFENKIFAVNFNAPGQVVISGASSLMDQCLETCRSAGARKVVRLNVSGAFHTPAMLPASKTLRRHASRLSFQSSDAVLYSNIDGRLLLGRQDWPDYLSRQMCSPVHWAAEIRQMIQDGVKVFYEIGPGTVLSGLVRRIAPGIPAWPIDHKDIDDRLTQCLTDLDSIG
jgi:[acyl-carrier-protein] S-malonyltransferase